MQNKIRNLALSRHVFVSYSVIFFNSVIQICKWYNTSALVKTQTIHHVRNSGIFIKEGGFAYVFDFRKKRARSLLGSRGCQGGYCPVWFKLEGSCSPQFSPMQFALFVNDFKKLSLMDSYHTAGYLSSCFLYNDNLFLCVYHNLTIHYGRVKANSESGDIVGTERWRPHAGPSKIRDMLWNRGVDVDIMPTENILQVLFEKINCQTRKFFWKRVSA